MFGVGDGVVLFLLVGVDVKVRWDEGKEVNRDWE